ncbi:hypothetical protein DFH28DRAFT_838632, partial [Melampsora americana]
MRSYKDLKLEILHLSQNCEFIRPATTKDLIYTVFKSPPKLADSDCEIGIFWTLNTKMNSIFGVTAIQKELFTGRYGMEQVMGWIDKVREHNTWDQDSEKLLIPKLESIHQHLMDHGAVLPDRPSCPSKKKPNLTSDPVAQSSASSTANIKHISSKASVAKGVKGLPSRCPNSTPGSPWCTLCQVVLTSGKDIFRCHCGKTISTPGGRTQNVIVHWSNGVCKKKADVMRQQPPIGSFFEKKQPAPDISPQEHESKRQAWQTSCCGLNDDTWLR